MSNPRAKAERSRAKDARQLPAQDLEPPQRFRPRLPKRRRPERSYVVEHLSRWLKDWMVVGRYRTLEEAEIVRAKWTRVYGEDRVKLTGPEEQR